MQQNYQKEELTLQTSTTVIYRTRTKNGIPHTLTQLKLSPEQAASLADGGFGQAYAKLLNLQHGCLRSVTEAGLDPAESTPWIATRWWEGKLLSDQIEKRSLTGADIARIQHHGESLIQAMEEVSGALSFDPERIVTTRSLEGEKVTTFEFDYMCWFVDSANGITPGTQQNAYANLGKLVDRLEDELAQSETSATTSILLPDEIPARPVNLLSSEISHSSGSSKKIAIAAAALIAIGISAAMLTQQDVPTPDIAAGSEPKAKPHFEEASQDDADGSLVQNNPTNPESSSSDQAVVRKRPASPEIGDRKNHEESDSSTSIAKTNRTISEQHASLLSQKIFTIEDEAQLRLMDKETITLRAMVDHYTETATKSTLYLVFHEEGPGFRAGISPERLGSDIDESWLRQFVGKEILITGTVTTFENAKNNRGKRLVIRFNKKSSINLAE